MPWTSQLTALCIYTSFYISFSSQSISQKKKKKRLISSFTGAPSVTGSATCCMHGQQTGNLKNDMKIFPTGNAARNPQAMNWDAVLKLFYFMHCINDRADLKSNILLLPLWKNL